jgi:hypothetical protein
LPLLPVELQDGQRVPTSWPFAQKVERRFGFAVDVTPSADAEAPPAQGAPVLPTQPDRN